MSNEEHLQEFYDFIVKNDKRLRKNLKKNITYNAELFDDAYENSIMKVANAILKGKRINDFEQYFFITSKFEYILLDNKDKRKQKIDTPIDDFDSIDEQYSEERDNKINKLIDITQNILEKNFKPYETDLFMVYYKLKANGNQVSYKRLSEITDIPLKEITQIIKNLKLFVRNNEEIKEYKKKLLYD